MDTDEQGALTLDALASALDALPDDLQHSILRHLGNAERAVCRRYRHVVDAHRGTLCLRNPAASGQPGFTIPPLSAWLARLPRLHSLDARECADAALAVRAAAPLASLVELRLSLRADAAHHALTRLTACTHLRLLLLHITCPNSGFERMGLIDDDDDANWDPSHNGPACSQLLAGPLAAVPALTDLDMGYCHCDPRHMACLQQCTSRVHLNLSACVSAPSFLAPTTAAPLTLLAFLNLSNCRTLTNITPLADRVSLHCVCLNECCNLTDCRALAGCRQLRTLHLMCTATSLASRFTYPARPQLLTACTSLTFFDLDLCRNLKDLRPLAVSRSLLTLRMRECSSVVELAALAKCAHLLALTLTYSPIADITPLLACTSLESLDLAWCNRITDIQPLSNCVNLCPLHLTHTAVHDLKPLANCSSITTLDLGGCNRITSLQPLGHLLCLQALVLENCTRMCDLRPLSTCQSLTTLGLHGCVAVTDVSPLARCRRLRAVDLRSCRGATDLSPLCACLDLLNLQYEGGSARAGF